MNNIALQPANGGGKVRKLLKRIQVQLKKNRVVEARLMAERAFSEGVRDPEFLHIYGQILRSCGNPQDALVKIHAAHELQPDDANILNSLGLVFLDLRDFETAITMFKRATIADEKLYIAWMNLGVTLKGAGRFNAAELAFTGAHYLDRRKQEPRLNLALLQVDMHRYERAAEILDDLLAQNKNLNSSIKLLRLQLAMELEDLQYVEKHVGKIDRNSLNEEECIGLDGVTAQYHIILDEFDEAIAILNRTSAIPGTHQGDHQAHLGFCYGLAGRLDEGILALEKLIKKYPDHVEGRHNLALLQFRKGNLKEGFENYEARLQMKEFATKFQRYDLPYWNGEEIKGKHILVWKEQGIGDEVRYASLLPELYERGCSVSIECSEKLAPLWRNSFPWADVIVAGENAPDRETAKQKFNYQIPLGSLGKYFRNTVDDFKCKQSPWIARDAEIESRVRDQIGVQQDEMLVGLCWRSMVQIASRDKVFFNCEQLAVLKDLPNARWLNLQYASTPEEISTLRGLGLDIHHYRDLDQKDDLVGACNLIGACDLVISVGGSVGDMAGGVGTPMIYMTRELSEVYLGTDYVPWFASCKPYPIKAYQTDASINRVIADWNQIVDWAQSLNPDDRKSETPLLAKRASATLDLDYAPVAEASP